MTSSANAYSEPQASLLNNLINKITIEMPYAADIADFLKENREIFSGDVFNEVDEHNLFYPIAKKPIQLREDDPDFYRKELAEGRRLNLNRKNPLRPELFIQNLYLALKLPEQKEEIKLLLAQFIDDKDVNTLREEVASLAKEAKEFLDGIKLINKMEVDSKKSAVVQEQLKKEWGKKITGVGFFDVDLSKDISRLGALQQEIEEKGKVKNKEKENVIVSRLLADVNSIQANYRSKVKSAKIPQKYQEIFDLINNKAISLSNSFVENKLSAKDMCDQMKIFLLQQRKKCDPDSTLGGFMDKVIHKYESPEKTIQNPSTRRLEK